MTEYLLRCFNSYHSLLNFQKGEGNWYIEKIFICCIKISYYFYQSCNAVRFLIPRARIFSSLGQEIVNDFIASLKKEKKLVASNGFSSSFKLFRRSPLVVIRSHLSTGNEKRIQEK